MRNTLMRWRAGILRLRLKCASSLLLIAAWLLSLGGCATPMPAPVACPETPQPPAGLLVPPAVKPGQFQKDVEDFFLRKPASSSLDVPSSQTKSPPTLGPAMSGSTD